jgi:hypothetical protein
MVSCGFLGLAACGGGSSGSGGGGHVVNENPLAIYSWTNATEQAQFVGRDGAGALVFTDPTDGVQKAWLLGGWNALHATGFTGTSAPGCCTTNEVWNSADGVNWHLVKPNSATGWEGRHMAGWAVFQGKMWIIGGDNNSGHYQTDVWNSSDGLNWTLVAASVPWAAASVAADQPGRVLHYALAFNDQLWVMGGQALPSALDPGPNPYPATPVYYSDVWYSSDGAHWNLAGSLPHALGMICGAVVFDGQMWVIGGGTYGDSQQGVAGTVYSEVWSSPDGVNWTMHANAPWPSRRYHSITVLDNRIWVLAGVGPDGGGQNLDDVWYSPDGEHWTQVPNTPWVPRHAASAFALNGSLWITGGSPNQGEQRNDVWKLDGG